MKILIQIFIENFQCYSIDPENWRWCAHFYYIYYCHLISFNLYCATSLTIAVIGVTWYGRKGFELGRNCLKQNALKKIMKENGWLSLVYSNLDFGFFGRYSQWVGFFANSILALRKAEKEEEKRAREKIRQKLEEDKVLAMCFCDFLFSLMYICWRYPISCTWPLNIWTNLPVDGWVCCFGVVCFRCLGLGRVFPLIFFCYYLFHFFQSNLWIELSPNLFTFPGRKT